MLLEREVRRRRAARTRRPAGIVAAVLAVIVLVAVVILAAIPPLVTRSMTHMHVAFDRVWSAEEFGLTAERIVLRTADGLDVVAYGVHADAPKAVAIFLSGTHNPSVTAFFGHAAMLHEHGYASLLLEMRAHGESQGERIGLGFEEYLDVQAAVTHLAGRPEYDGVPIVAYGVSLGGATAINAMGRTPAIDAVVSLAAFSSWSDVFVDSMGLPEPLARLQRPFVDLYTGLTYGFDRRDVTPKAQIRHLGDRPALLMHAREDAQVPVASFERLVANAPAHVETWLREGDAHLVVAGSFLRPADDAAYTERVLGFLERHFGR